MTTAIVQRSVEFHGNSLIVIHQDGVDYTPVKALCDILGIDWEGQRQRIDRDEVLRKGACMIQAPSAGGSQQMLCLPLDYLNGWLFGVQVSLIRPELRDRLVLYKRECYRALALAFQGGATTARLAGLETRIAALEASQRAARAIETATISPQAASIIAVLQANSQGGPLSSQAIIRALRDAGHSVSQRPTWLRLRRMAARGLIERCGRGVYRLNSDRSDRIVIEGRSLSTMASESRNRPTVIDADTPITINHEPKTVIGG